MCRYVSYLKKLKQGGETMRINLKLFRVSKGLNQTEMAEILGLSRITYGAIERGERDTFQKTWDKLQQHFEIPDGEMWDLVKNM